MKKLILAISIFFAMLASGYSEEHDLFPVGVQVFDESSGMYADENFYIKYDDTDKRYYFFFDDDYTSSWITLTQKDMLRIRQALEKYFEWSATAKAENVNVNKVIPDTSIQSPMAWYLDDTWHYTSTYENSTTQPVMTFTAYSTAPANAYFVIRTTRAVADDNKYVKCKIPDLYLTRSEAKQFYNELNPENIKKLIKQIQEEQSKSDVLFR